MNGKRILLPVEVWVLYKRNGKAGTLVAIDKHIFEGKQ
jgi:hypothetical protein